MRKFEVILRRKSAPDPAAAAPSQSASPGAGKTAAPPDKSGGGEEKGGGLAGIGVALTGLVATIGALTLTGTMGRVQRDNPEAIIAALILVVAAGGAWTIAVTVDSVGYKKWGLGLKTAATVLGVGGFIVALCIAVSTANHQPRPQISAELSGDHKTLTSTVTASNLSSTRRLAFRINLNRADKTAQPLYRSYVGPTSDGDVKQTIVTPLPNLSPYRQIEVQAYSGTTTPFCKEYERVTEDASIGSGTGCILITLLPERKSKVPPGTGSLP